MSEKHNPLARTLTDGEEPFAGAAFLLLVTVFFVTAAAAALRGMPAGQPARRYTR